MPIIEWNSSFFIGIIEVDQHHQTLVALLNRIYDGQKVGIPSNELQSIIVELIDYAKYHFSCEELLMQTHAYPEFYLHKEEHDIFSDRVIEIQKDFKLGIDISIEIVSFLINWITYHIRKTDTIFGEFMAARKVSDKLLMKFD